MSKTAKIWLFIALSLTLVGAIVFTVTMCAINWNFSALSTVEYVTSTYEITEKFTGITIKCSTADVCVLASPDDTYKVECVEQKNVSYTVEVKERALTITENDTRALHEHISIGSGERSKITVYLPGGVAGNVEITTSTGDITIQGVHSNHLTLRVTTGDIALSDYVCRGDVCLRGSTGDVTLRNVSCKSITSTAGTGDIALDNVTATEKFDITRTTGTVSLDNSAAPEIRAETSSGEVKMSNVLCNSVTSTANTGGIILKNVVAEEKIEITRSTGDVRFIRSDAAEISVRTDTGDVTGSLLSGKDFEVDTDTGDIRVPQSTSGGKCTIKTSTGDVNITIADNDQIPPTP